MTLARRVARAGRSGLRRGRDVLRGRNGAKVEDEFPLGMLDRPEEGADVGAVLAANGWIRHDAGYDRVELRLDGGAPQRARLLAHGRPDLAGALDEPTAGMAGWEALLDVPVADGDRVELEVEAVGPAGRLLLGRRTLAVRSPAVPVRDPGRLAVVRARADAMAAGHRPRGGGVHLLAVTHHLGLGGGQLYLQELLRQVLAAENVSCTVLAQVDGVLRDELEGWGAQVHVTGLVPLDGLDYEARMLELAGLAVATRANVVLVNTTGAFWGADLAGRLGVPAVWAIHESFTVDHFERAAWARPPDVHVAARLRAALAGASAAVFEADATRRLYEPALAPGRSVRIDYGVDLDRIDRYRRDHDRDALRAAHGVGPDECLLVCVGTYEPRKAQAGLAVAFAQVADGHPGSVLALVGDTGTDYARGVQGLVDRLGVGDRVMLEPVTPDVDAWYLMADGFVLASDVESLPRSMLEAMAFGVPVIASAVFGVPEVITDGHDGLLFEPLDLGSLTAALDRFLALPPGEREAVGARGRRHVETVRPSKYYADAYRRLFDALVEDPAALPGAALGRP